MSKHAIYFTEPSLTKQSFKDECNINKIMDRFQRTGAIDHYMAYGGQYQDTPSSSLHEAMNVVADAESMFEELPATLRKKFANDPGKFLDFVQDPKNLDEMRELGLANKKAPSQQPNDEIKTTKGSAKAKKEASKESEPDNDSQEDK